MKLKLLTLIFSAALISACSKGFHSASSASVAYTYDPPAVGGGTTTGGTTPPTGTTTTSKILPVVGNEANVVRITMSCGYLNEPCVTVTVCAPGTTTCQTINNILLDTGSSGLRVFASVFSTTLQNSLPVLVNAQKTQAYTECYPYADGTADWGTVRVADIQMGGLKATNVSMQLIDSTWAKIPAGCGQPDTSPSVAGYNGILGVGLFGPDCGAACVTNSNIGLYYLCTATSCTPSTMALADQIANPASRMPSGYNNGVITQMDTISSAGSVSAGGYLILGIGSAANNTPPSGAGIVTMPTDAGGNFRTTFNGQLFTSSFIDSGSNGLFFPGASNLPQCGQNSIVAGWFCPASLTALTATQAGANGSPSVSVAFNIMSAETAAAQSNPNVMFNDIGAATAGTFDWGMPFFFGRTIYVGFENSSSSLGSGTYWAY